MSGTRALAGSCRNARPACTPGWTLCEPGAYRLLMKQCSAPGDYSTISWPVISARCPGAVQKKR